MLMELQVQQPLGHSEPSYWGVALMLQRCWQTDDGLS